MYGEFQAHLQAELDSIEAQNLTKNERFIASQQSARVEVNGRELINLCANNYLGLANNPEIMAAAREGLDERGFGMASVRFIRSSTPPASMPMAACSKPCSAPKTQSFRTSSTTPASSMASACQRPCAIVTRTTTWPISKRS